MEQVAAVVIGLAVLSVLMFEAGRRGEYAKGHKAGYDRGYQAATRMFRAVTPPDRPEPRDPTIAEGWRRYRS